MFGKRFKNVVVFRLAFTLIISFPFFFIPPRSLAQENLFPVFPSIENNVTFWEKVYSTYSLTQGIIHDADDLSIIYDVVELVPQGQRGARRINRQRIKDAKKRYEHILLKLAKGEAPETAEEQRVLNLFGPQRSGSELYNASKNIRFQLGQKERFKGGIIRSGAYLDRVKEIFRSYELPEDLAYLAHVESSYNYNAYSKFGAAGMWQFTRSTGKLFMKVDYTLDERRDPILSTHAAAKLLKKNHAELSGSWPLALTAYNHGRTGMMRAQELYGDYEAIFNKYTSRTFKFASKNFYSEFLAARNIAHQHEKHFGALELDEPFETCEVKIQGYAAITDLADYFQVELDTLKQLNPALRPPVFLGQKYVPPGCTLRLPAEKSAHLDNSGNPIPSKLYKDDQKHSQFYRVARGDTVGKIARRHRVSERELALANNLNSRSTIYAGQNLRIPTSGEQIVYLTASKKRAKSKEKVLVAALQKEKTIVEEPAEIEESEFEQAENENTDDEQPDSYQQASVVPFSNIGDKVISEVLSSWSPEDKKKTSSVDLHAGINPAVITGNLDVDKVFESGGDMFGIITVEAEETIGHYAEWLEISAAEVRRINDMRYGRAIHISQPIVIPLNKKVSKTEFEERRYEYHKEMEEDFWAAYRVEGVRTYMIKRGDNIWTLCKSKFDLPFWVIKKFNDSIDFNKLMPSQTLNVPVVDKTG